MQCANQTFVHAFEEQVASTAPRRARKNKSEKNSTKKSHNNNSRRKSKEEEFFDRCADPEEEKTNKGVGSDQGLLSEANSEETIDSVNKSGNTQTHECDGTKRNSPDVKDLNEDGVHHLCLEWLLVGMATPNNSFDEEEEASEMKRGPSSVFYTAKAVTDETEVPQLSTIEGLLELSENTEIPLCPSVCQTGGDEERVSGEEPLRAKGEPHKSRGGTIVSKENGDRAPGENTGKGHQEEESAETREEASAPSFDEIFTETKNLLMAVEQQTESLEENETDEPKVYSANLLSNQEERR